MAMARLPPPNDNSNTVSIRLGNGSGDSLPAAQVAVGSAPGRSSTGDFNGDGIQDFGLPPSNNVSIVGKCSAAPGAVGIGLIGKAIGDFNGDGIQDFATANEGSGNVSIRLGNGSGGFTSPATPEVAVGSNANSVAIGDFNGDGIQDFAAANEGSNTVSIRLGNGSGGFTSPASPEVAVGSAPFSVAIGDFNGDGRQDFAAANFSSNDVSVRLGVCTPTVVSATTGDSNSNGKIDRLTVVYSEAVNDPNYDAVAVTGYSMPGTGSGTGTTTLVYNLTEDGDGCSPLTLTITNVGTESGNGTSECFAYSHSVFLQSSPNQTPTITGAPGGTFSSTPFGLSINPSTGTINSATSSLGDYVVTYTTDPVIAGVLDTGATPALTFIAADATDLAGNNLDTAGAPTNATDGAAPTVGIVIADTALKAGDTSLVTFTFSEAVTGFTNADLTIPNGTFGGAVASGDGGVTWTATFTPTPGIEAATNVITVDMTGVADLAANAGVGTTDSSNYAIDTLAPAAPIITHIAGNESINISEKAAIHVTGTAVADSLVSVTLSDGTNSVTATQQLSGGGTAYDITLDGTVAAPAALVDGTITPSVTATDAAGNTSTATTTRQPGKIPRRLPFHRLSVR